MEQWGPSLWTYGSVFQGAAGERGGAPPCETMSDIEALQQSLIELANTTTDEALLAAACELLRGNADEIVWEALIKG